MFCSKNCHACTELPSSTEWFTLTRTSPWRIDAGIITEAAIESFRKEFNSKLELLAEVDRDTLYFDGFEAIRRELKEIRQKNSSFRIVVFVDDLDRCSPTKTLEVLESIKVFLGMEGFIYVMGLSHLKKRNTTTIDENSSFLGALIDDSNFLDYIRRFTKKGSWKNR